MYPKPPTLSKTQLPVAAPAIRAELALFGLNPAEWQLSWIGATVYLKATHVTDREFQLKVKMRSLSLVRDLPPPLLIESIEWLPEMADEALPSVARH